MTRWILPALCALGIHAALFNLDVAMTRPAFSITESRAVTLSLTQLSPPPEPAKQISPLPPPRARTVEPLSTLKVPRAKTRQAAVPPPAPIAPMPPARVEQVPSEPEPIDATVADDETSTPSSERPDPQEKVSNLPEPQAMRQPRSGPESAEVHASVPLYATNPPPVYPSAARRRNYQGTVLLDVLVDRQGRAAQVKIATSSGHTVLDQSALQSVRRWRFEPGRRMGEAIEMWVQVPVRFALE